MKTILLASAPDLISITKLIAKYWYTTENSIELSEVNKNYFDIYRSTQRIDSFRVVLKAKRYRFEGIL